ncbi:MAG TPA: energy transducer TonB, partial [Opitutus sp.]|nr:energy transducer TonB [Opitutus sp.]
MNTHLPAAFAVSTPLRPSASRVPAAGAWRYRAPRRTRAAAWGAVLFSAGVHAVILFAFNRKAAPKAAVGVEEAFAVQLVMPDLKDLEEPEVEPFEGDEEPVDAGISVPMLADTPAFVDLTNAFLQEIDYSSLVPQQDLTGAKTLSIPTNIHRGGKIGEGMGKVFDLKDLDRAPEPLVRIAPVVPVGMRQQGFKAEVVVGFIVDANGAVTGAYVVRSSDRNLEESALLAMGKWKFRP